MKHPQQAENQLQDKDKKQNDINKMSNACGMRLIKRKINLRYRKYE